MSSQPPKSIAALLWELMRLSMKALWTHSANPARSALERQQALAILGLPSNATPDQIKRRYRYLAKKHHPDRGGDPQQMQKIIAAYTLLTREHRV